MSYICLVEESLNIKIQFMELREKYLRLVEETKENVSELSVGEVNKMMNNGDDFILIDIREESEWREKKIPDSIYIGKGILEREIESIAPHEDTIIVLFCAGGYRSILAAENLQRMGYKNVFSMSGGIGEWEEKGLPII